MKDERGQVLALALATLAVGVILIAPFLNTVSVHSIASRTYSSSISQVYAADAGIEDAIWALTRGSLASQLTYAGASVSHTVSEQINGISPTVSVTRYTVQVASENFESGDWTGGSGWLSNWSTAGSSDVIKQNSPYQGLYHMRLRSSVSYANRSANLSGQSGLHLTFWAKVNSFEPSDTLAC